MLTNNAKRRFTSTLLDFVFPFPIGVSVAIPRARGLTRQNSETRLSSGHLLPQNTCSGSVPFVCAGCMTTSLHLQTQGQIGAASPPANRTRKSNAPSVNQAWRCTKIGPSVESCAHCRFPVWRMHLECCKALLSWNSMSLCSGSVVQVSSLAT